ncbi:hypothetical protein Plhal304r1_c034g0106091 [Plasmopara halstedii]
MVIDTSRTLTKTSLQKIIVFLYHGNEALEQSFGEVAIGQVSKLSGGSLRKEVKTDKAYLTLERAKINIRGGVEAQHSW